MLVNQIHITKLISQLKVFSTLVQKIKIQLLIKIIESKQVIKYFSMEFVKI